MMSSTFQNKNARTVLILEMVLWGLPLPWQKKLLNLAFAAPESPEGTLIQVPKTCAYSINNQWYMQHTLGIIDRLLSFKTVGADFEFNKPILKKGVRILNDFKKNSTDFEGFVMDFEKHIFPK